MKSKSSPPPFVVGVDLGGTKILAAVFDKKNRLLGEKKKNTRAELGPAGVVARIASCVDGAIQAADLSCDQVPAIGVGIPGVVDADRGWVRVAPNLRWKNVPFAELFRRHIKTPVRVINDVQAGTMAVQRFGAGQRYHDFVCMFVGTGIGGGLVLRGHPYRGADGLGGEIGHMVVASPNGPKCACGGRGCLEAVASRTAIVRRLTDAMAKGQRTRLKQIQEGPKDRIRSRHLAQAYHAGDPLVVKVLHEACDYLGIGSANLINLLNPQAVIFGGGLIEALGDHLLPRIAAAAQRQTVWRGINPVRILDTGLGDYAGVLGAAAVTRDLP